MKLKLLSLMHYLFEKADRAFDGLTGELSQNRILLIWIYSLAFLVLIFYTAVTNKSSHNTAIITVGGIIGTCFSSWVCTSAYVKVHTQKKEMSEDAQKEASGD